ncbi:hypothetical protein HT102_11230 [Hoyosella sp. G463]|uniref:Uncharacterized protein n=1 Tax=Lolliginicoccus lacisalsi TaxID=2742202 RepID=A0A927JDY9_9ACTN|nr:hypothetical protein [Lolliginicoccus lacisalsi]MBD8507060.1 hypothetical protein [Lolliginicoccus lacisalsi]
MNKDAPRDPADITGGDQIATTPEDARENVEAERLASDDSTVPGEEQPPAGSPEAAGQSASQPAESDEAADEDEDSDAAESDEDSVMGQPSVMPGTNGAVAGTAFSDYVENDETANRNPAVAKQRETKKEEFR